MSDTPDNADEEQPKYWAIATISQLQFTATKDDGESRPYLTVTRSDMTADKLIIRDPDGEIIVSISLIDGTVDLQQPGKVPEAAEQFWRAIATQFSISTRDSV